MKLLRQVRALFTKHLVPNAATVAGKDSSFTTEDTFAQEISLALQAEHPDLLIEVAHNRLSINQLSLVIDCLVGEQNRHPNAVVIGLEVRAFHERFFPAGIIDCLAGIGADEATAIAKGAQNYVTGVLLALISALSTRHTPELDFRDSSAHLLWHPVVGILQVQGAWTARAGELEPAYFFHLLQPLLGKLLTDRPFHWLKIYVSRMPDGEYISDCFFDNEPWPAGLEALRQEAANWNTASDFAGQKQFLLFRQCPVS